MFGGCCLHFLHHPRRPRDRKWGRKKDTSSSVFFFFFFFCPFRLRPNHLSISVISVTKCNIYVTLNKNYYRGILIHLGDLKFYADSFSFSVEVRGVDTSCSSQSTVLPALVRHAGFVCQPTVNPHGARK